MTTFSDAYNHLNNAQRQAVDTIEGPLLVIAGPGTGKTQLLSARVANILQKTDTPPQNILCLTFTESGAANMRERLTRFIGQSAYEVTISTYHAFGSDLIGRYPEYYADMRLQNAVDELGKRQIIQEIVEAMRFDNPLKQTRHHLGDLISTISEIKRALLSPDNLRALAVENVDFITSASKLVQPIFAVVSKMPSSLAKAQPLFEETLAALASLVPRKPVSSHFQPLAVLCVTELQAALEQAIEKGKSTPLTVWKNDWLAKDADNHFILTGELENRRIHALADVLEAYHSSLGRQGLYDFDDMILRSIEALEKHADLRYTLQERYLYILLDEFQDTNAAQLKLVRLLTDNPTSEGRPNILAVGDDDQAIYAFQGAQYSNMLEYFKMYQGTAVINLTENYRSHADILSTAHNIAQQISSRLQQHFPGMTKTLMAANTSLPDAEIERREFQSEIAERAWIAAEIKRLIDAGTSPHDIAVLSPKHKQLEQLVPFLNDAGVPVRYEKRENILEAPVVRQLVAMSLLLLALSTQDTASASALWPQILSYDFWQIPVAEVWRLSWKVSDSRSRDSTAPSDELNVAASKLTWNQAVLDSDVPQIQLAGAVLLAAAGRISTDNCETVLDYLIGSSALETNAGPAVASPLRGYYTSPEMQQLKPELFYETMSHLTVLRSRLREYQGQADAALMIRDFIAFISLYESAEQPMIDTSPYSQQADSVQLLTVFKAKGLEYQHVFLPNCLDDVWGSSSRGNSNKITLPANLRPIRHAGATDDERLRILFVALTRARSGLHLSSATRSFSGKASKRLKYFDEQEQLDGRFQAMVLPKAVRVVASDDSQAPAVKQLELDWRSRHLHGLKEVSLESLLSERTENYQLSPTHMVSFVDLEYAGPERFFFDAILRFPRAVSADSHFGTAIHETLEWYQHQISKQQQAPEIAEALKQFDLRIASKKLTEQRAIIEIDRGHAALKNYLEQRSHIFKPTDVAEKNFRSEAVFCGPVHMSGKVDKLEINNTNRTITVVDYKTGHSLSGWKNDIKAHRYQLQLYAYKVLIEGSKRYKGFNVPLGRLEFIESDRPGRIDTLELRFQDDELARVRKLMEAVWNHVKALEFPAVDHYPATLAGIKQYEQDLIDGVL